MMKNSNPYKWFMGILGLCLLGSYFLVQKSISMEKIPIVISESYFDINQDGKPEKIYRANYAFRAVPLSAGAHRIRFVYDPVSFRLGAGVTLLGILGCIGMGWVWRRKGTDQ